MDSQGIRIQNNAGLTTRRERIRDGLQKKTGIRPRLTGPGGVDEIAYIRGIEALETKIGGGDHANSKRPQN